MVSACSGRLLSWLAVNDKLALMKRGCCMATRIFLFRKVFDVLPPTGCIPLHEGQPPHVYRSLPEFTPRRGAPRGRTPPPLRPAPLLASGPSIHQDHPENWRKRVAIPRTAGRETPALASAAAPSEDKYNINSLTILGNACIMGIALCTMPVRYRWNKHG